MPTNDMEETQTIYSSLILQLAIDGKADLDQLSPGVASFIRSVVGHYLENPNDHWNQQWYYYANEFFESNKEKLN